MLTLITSKVMKHIEKTDTVKNLSVDILQKLPSTDFIHITNSQTNITCPNNISYSVDDENIDHILDFVTSIEIIKHLKYEKYIVSTIIEFFEVFKLEIYTNYSAIIFTSKSVPIVSLSNKDLLNVNKPVIIVDLFKVKFIVDSNVDSKMRSINVSLNKSVSYRFLPPVCISFFLIGFFSHKLYTV